MNTKKSGSEVCFVCPGRGCKTAAAVSQVRANLKIEVVDQKPKMQNFNVEGTTPARVRRTSGERTKSAR